MDFIFGTLSTAELKALRHRSQRRGVQHGYALTPRDPQPDKPVTLTVRTGADVSADYVACYFTLDGSLPQGHRGIPSHGHMIPLHNTGAEWDTLSWTYSAVWQGELPPAPEGTLVRYQISAWAEDTSQLEVFADYPDLKMTSEAASSLVAAGNKLPENFALGDSKSGTLFSYRVDRFSAPAWAYDTVIYHIFIDRFYPGNGKIWLQTKDLKSFCGGTLWGIIDKLDYIASLGANCIWLSPTWVSPSHHGYDAIDYTKTEPRLGGDEGLRALVEAAHARGVRILLDLVCNHISHEHPIFQSAKASTTSPYRDWFTFDDSKVGYRSFFGVASMPQLNLANPAAREWMIDIARYWLREFKVDGYRLDYANGPVTDFWTDFWVACKQENADCICFGEVIDAPDIIPQYIGRMDGCLDFHLSAAFRQTYAWKTMAKSELQQLITHHYAYFPTDFLLPVFLDNHDMDRFLFIANGDKQALHEAAAHQMQLPGIPVIYYGTEVGLSQQVSTRAGSGLHVSRTPMLWNGEQDHELLDYYRSLIQARHARHS